MPKSLIVLALALAGPALAQDDAPAEDAPADDSPTDDSADEVATEATEEVPAPPEKEPEAPKNPPKVEHAGAAPAFVFGDAPPEEADKDCWIRLVSGEWLKAELKNLRNGDLVIDSDKLGDQTLSFSDVDAFWVPRAHIWVDRKRGTLVGPAMLKDGVLTVRTGGGMQTLQRHQLTSIVKGDGHELSLWGFDADLGADMRLGNSKQLTATANARVTREGPVIRWTLGYGGSIGRSEGLETVNWHKGDTKLDAFVNAVFYLTPVTSEIYHDQFQNIELRTMVGTGLGYRWVATGAVTWTGYAGGLFQNTRYITPLEDGGSSFVGGGATVAMGFEFEPNGDLEIDLDWRSNLIFNDFDQTSHEGILNIDYDLTGAFSIFMRVIYTRIEGPPTAEDGTTPMSDDAQLITGISVSI